jgi:hypothetical protein
VAGYSGTPLVRKLGINAGARLVLLNAPEGFDETLGSLPDDVSVSTRAGGRADVVVLFTTERRVLDTRLDGLQEMIAPNGAIWVSWPKKASKVLTDVTEDVVREVALPRGLVDNKVCAIDDVWSGLRLVIRRQLR